MPLKENIILCGLPGIGKTETGKLMADYLGWICVDTDLYLEKFYENTTGVHLTCRQIYTEVGEAAFRELEHRMLTAMQDLKHCVVSVGGGTLSNPGNIILVKNIGELVYLKNDRKIIYERLMRKGMPAYLNPENPYLSFEKIAEARERIYDSVADRTFETGQLAPSEIASRIIEALSPRFNKKD